MFLFVFWIWCSADFSYNQKCSLSSKRLRIADLGLQRSTSRLPARFRILGLDGGVREK